MLFNIAGTNGAGKTTLVRNLLGDQYETVDLIRYEDKKGRIKKIKGAIGNDTVAVGPYRKNVASGGCDCIPTQDLLRGAVVAANYKFPGCDIVFEGIIVSTIFQRYRAWAEGRGTDLRFGYLNTPLEICFQNIRKRQEKSGKIREIKTDLVENKWRSIQTRRQKMIDAGLRVYDIPYDNSVPWLRQHVLRYGSNKQNG